MKIANIVFENADRLPNNVYIDLMNLLKKYYETNDHDDLEKYLNDNVNNIPSDLLLKIKNNLYGNSCFNTCLIAAFIVFIVLSMSGILIRFF